MSDDLLSRVLRRIGRAAHPLFDPDDLGRRSHEAEGATRRALEKLARDVEHLGARVDRVNDRVDKVDRRSVQVLQDSVAELRWSTQRQMAFSDRLQRAVHGEREHEFLREHALRRLRHVDKHRGPVIVGPWTGEVGFELLYWVPFVRWAVQRFGIDPARVTIVSRGGTASWYGLEGARYVDVLSRRSPEEFRAQSEQQKKQRTLRAFDRRLLRELRAEMTGPVGLLHPALMYALFMPFWKQKVAYRWISDFVHAARVAPPVVPGLSLPRDYVAVRFYYSQCFPDTPDNRALVETVVRSLARERDVVLLGSGVRLDDHHDATPGASLPRVHTVDHLLTPETNLAVQTAVIAGASSFVGTYGGFSYLAPLCGVNTLAVYSVKNFYPYHLDFAQRLFAEVGGGSLTVVDTAMRDLVARLGPATSLT